jgi:glycosyltransferase involved in cell wall biosynthesis
VADERAGRALTFVVPGDLQTRTGGYGYDRRILAGLRERGWQVDLVALDGTFPFPTRTARDDAARRLAAVPDGATVLVDGLALGALPEEAEREGRRLNLIALVHHPLAQETGLDPATAESLERSERRALAAVRSVVVTGESTAAGLSRYGVAPERITVVQPGTDRAPVARGSLTAEDEDSGAGELTLLCVATLTPRKGHEILFRALASIPHRRWRLRCAGSLDRDPALVERLVAMLRSEGLDGRVDLLGDLGADRLAVEYDCSDVFVLSTLYEGFGMAVAEALARGLPVVSTATGNIAALVGTGAGIVVAPGDAGAFTEALTRVASDPGLRRRLADGARRVRERLPTWEESVAAMARVLSTVPHSAPESHSGTMPEPDRGTVPGTVAGFSADWLALREPADRAARSARLAQSVAALFAEDAPLSVVDLGAGTGANLRYLAWFLPPRQRWLLVDHDAALLAQAIGADARSGKVEARPFDLNVISGDEGRALFSGAGLVTASALLDLVSENWLRTLAECGRESHSALLFALTYDGRIECAPGAPHDAAIRDLVNRHQRRDKGFGPALGPDATQVAVRVLHEAGYHVERDRSDWVLGPESEELQRQLVDGWARAAIEVEPAGRQTIEAWRTQRLEHVDQRRSRLVVGHEDLAAWLRR